MLCNAVCADMKSVLYTLLPVLVQCARTLSPHHPATKIFHPLLLHRWSADSIYHDEQKLHTAVLGQDMCGEFSYLTKHALEHLGHTTIKRVESGMDHTFLLWKVNGESIVIDPTIRQMCATDIIAYSKEGQLLSTHCPYTEHVHENIAPIFVGTIDELREQQASLIELHQRTIGKGVRWTTFETQLERRMSLWTNCTDAPTIDNATYQSVLSELETALDAHSTQ